MNDLSGVFFLRFKKKFLLLEFGQYTYFWIGFEAHCKIDSFFPLTHTYSLFRNKRFALDLMP